MPGPLRRRPHTSRALGAVCALILTAATGCDNVSWGGVEVAVIPPPPRGGEEPEDAEVPTTPGALPSGPVLYHVRRTADGPLLRPVAEVGGDTLRPLGDLAQPDRYWTRFVGEHMREGSEFVLFLRGRRVGTLVLHEAGLAPAGTCPALPRGTGVMELTSEAGEAPEFLALPRTLAPEVRMAVDSALFQMGRRMSIVGPILAERMLRSRGASLPGNWQAAMRQAIPFPVEGRREPAFTATFLVGDTLGPGLDDEGYSLFFVAIPDPGATGYDTAFVRFRDYGDTGKAAPRVIDFLDWDRDGEAELLLEVFGTGNPWFEAVGRASGEWRTLFELRCEAGEAEAAAAAAAAADSVTADTVSGSAPVPPAEQATPPPG